MLVARYTRPEGHFKVWATPRAETGLPPLQSMWMYAWVSSVRSLAGRAESQPPQFYVASVTTGTRTHILLIKHQRLNPVLLTARPC